MKRREKKFSLHFLQFPLNEREREREKGTESVRERQRCLTAVCDFGNREIPIEEKVHKWMKNRVNLFYHYDKNDSAASSSGNRVYRV